MLWYNTEQGYPKRKEGIIIEFSTITVTMPTEEADKLLEILKENNLSVTQIVNAFLRWVIRDTAAALKFIGIDINTLRRPRINMITQQEFCDHANDNDFLLRYGNPVAIRSDDGTMLVCMAVEYYEQMTGDKLKIVDNKETERNG